MSLFDVKNDSFVDWKKMLNLPFFSLLNNFDSLFFDLLTKVSASFPVKAKHVERSFILVLILSLLLDCIKKKLCNPDKVVAELHAVKKFAVYNGFSMWIVKSVLQHTFNKDSERSKNNQNEDETTNRYI